MLFGVNLIPFNTRLSLAVSSVSSYLETSSELQNLQALAFERIMLSMLAIICL